MKETFKLYLANEIDSKKKLLLANSISDEDKALIQEQIDNLNAMVEKVDELEGEGVQPVIDELKTTVAEMGEKLESLNEKLNQNKTEEQDNKEMNYLETKNSVADFANCIRNSHNAEEFRANWMDTVKANAATETVTIEQGSEEAYLPAVVKGMINDIWDRKADWLKDLNYTGAKRFYVRHNTSDQTAEDSRAKGWKKGDTKAAQRLTMAAKLLEPQAIYKIAEISLQTKFEDDNSLITYVLNELTDQILYEIKRAILVGDGRQNNDDYKISSFEAVNKTVTDDYTTVTTAASDFLVDDLRATVDSIVNDNGKAVYAFMSKDTLRTLARLQSSATSTPVYLSNEQVAEQIGASRIITTDLLPSTTKMVAFIPNEYYLVGAPNLLTPILYSWHEGYKNLDVYRNETWAGGGINALKSSAVCTAE